ncbi:MAG TPA: amylo-alpha-1,6-glucosidase, partial [Burkholderiales bacterium]|nr:amylo-alpha-1,6-glucosidase [Burkholderiales bacterium]
MNKDLLVLHWKGEDATLLHQREWLATNGLGGFASGTVLGVNSRRYHGLFVPNLAEPKGRYIMISRFDEELICGEVRTQLGGAQYTDGRLLTKAQHYLESFSVDHLMPVWTYRIGDCRLEKTLVLPHGQNTVVVQYRLLEGGPATLHLRPFLAFRRQDAVLRRHEGWPFTLSITGNRHEVSLLDSPLRMRFGIRPEQGAFVAHPHKEENIMYQVERDRGYDHSENAFSPGYFSVAMSVGQPVSFVATTQGWEALETDGISAITAERERIEKLMSIVPEKASKGFAQKLAMAADQFLILPGSRLEETSRAAASGNEVRTIIAGYHWFGDWGRDTMISLDGLTLCTGRFREAGAILRTFSRYVRDGLLPNLFPEGEREALYHTVDATLWYFHAIDRYVNVVGDEEILNELWPVLSGIIEHHLRGTHYGIGVDPEDGLVRAGAPGYQLTWMDAKVGDWVVTPRRGKPVEIQALWHNALNLMVDWGTRLGHDVEAYKAHAIRARNSFNRRFWNESGRYLNDVIDTEGGGIDTSFRPN